MIIEAEKDKNLKPFLKGLNSLSKKYSLYIDSDEESPHIRNGGGNIILDCLFFDGKTGKYKGDFYIEQRQYIPDDKKGFCSYCEYFRKATKCCGNPNSIYYYALPQNEYIILNGQNNTCDHYEERKDSK